MQPMAAHLLKALILLAVQGVLFLGCVALAVRNRKAFAAYARGGLLLGLILFVMGLPGIAFTLTYADASSLDPPMQFAFHVGLVVAVVAHILKIGWSLVLYVTAAAEWQRAGSRCFPFEHTHVKPARRELVGAFAFGVFAASVTVIIFLPLGVQEGEMFEQLRRIFPGAATASPVVLLPVAVSFLSAAAIGEEFTYRGGLLGLLNQIPGHRVILRHTGVVLLSLMWALAHIPNTQMPFVKVAQVFAIGIVLAEITRRSSLYAAIAGHVGLNVGSLVIAVAYECLT